MDKNCIEKNIPEFIEASKTIFRWKEYILNSFVDKRYSNGYNSPKVIADVYIDDCGCGPNTWEDFFNARDNKKIILF